MPTPRAYAEPQGKAYVECAFLIATVTFFPPSFSFCRTEWPVFSSTAPQENPRNRLSKFQYFAGDPASTLASEEVRNGHATRPMFT